MTGRFGKLRLAETPPHPDLLPARGEKETAVRWDSPNEASESQRYAVARRTLRLALRSKNSAWLMTAETAEG